MTSNRAASVARQRAHEALAIHRQQRLEREKANETDLATYLLLEQQIADAEEHVHKVVAALRRKQGEHLRHWYDRGEKLSDIAKLTGKPVAEVSRLMKATPEPAHTDVG
ncbi:hypothetical protein [Nocardia niigatensis]